MTISRDHGDITFECDSCADEYETHEDNFDIAWNMAKRDGWRARKVGNVWQHFCEDCDEED